MRKLAVTTFLSLDGVMQSPGAPEEDPSNGFTHGGWLVPYADQEMGSQMIEWFSHAEDFLIGRGTYESFVAHWPRVPTENDPIAEALNTLPKHVASRTLDHVDWNGARLIQGDVVEAVSALKNRNGGELQVHGSAGLIETLWLHDLVDELRLMIFPVVLGTGKRLFANGTVPAGLTLGSSTATSAGVVILTYERTGELQVGSFALDHA